MDSLRRRKMTWLLELCLLVALAAIGAAVMNASAATAHPGGWYWTRSGAESYILTKTSTSDGEDITDASCSGMGTPWRRSGRVLWHHLRCEENDDLDREFTAIVHPTSRYHAAVIEISCDDSYSESTCP